MNETAPKMDRHGVTPNRCGAVGYIAYRDGKPWSVNVGRDERPVDWRFQLDRNPSYIDCPECRRLVG